MRRLLSTALLAALVFGLLGGAPVPAQAKFSRPADLMPAATSFYIELDTSDVPGLLDRIAALVGRAGLPLNRQFLLASLDSGLREPLQGISFSDEVLPWLGPSIAAGVVIPEDMPPGQNPFPVQDGMVVVSVTDDTAARGALEKFIAAIEGRGVTMERTETTLNGQPLIGYAYEPSNTGMAWLPGFLVFGPLTTLNGWFENVRQGEPVLGGQADFAAVWDQFRPGSLVKGYARGALLEALINSTAQNPAYGMQERAVLAGMEIFTAFKAFGFALRGEGRSLALDLIGSIDTAREAELMQRAGVPAFTLVPNTGALAARIPADAVAVIDWGDLAGMIDYLRNIPAFEQQFRIAADELRAETQIDLEDDVLSWLGGEFATYIALDAEALLQGAGASAPFAWTFLAQVDDSAPVRSFLGKLETYLTALAADTEPNPFVALETDYYAIDSGDPTMGTLAFGLVNDAFVLTVGGDPGIAAAAARGDGTLAQSPVWQHVVEEVPAFNQPVFFLNLDALYAMLDEAVRQNAQMSDPSFSQLMGVLNLFESALLYGSDQGDGNVVASAVLMLREPLP